MSRVIFLSPASVLLSDTAECDRLLFEESVGESGDTSARQGTSESLAASVLREAFFGVMTSYISPAMMDHARRGPRQNDFVCRPSDGMRALLNQRSRIAWSVERMTEYFGFRVSQAAELIMFFISLADTAAMFAISAGAALRSAGSTSARALPRFGIGAGRQGARPAARALFEVVELGAGDLAAANRLARQADIRVTAVDPVLPPAAVRAELERAGGRYIQGTAADVAANAADQVVWYFPLPVERSGGRFVARGTYGFSYTRNAVEHALRIVRPGGTITLVTESEETALHFARSASRSGARVVVTRTTSGQAAAGATGFGVPGMSPDLPVFSVNLYKSEPGVLEARALARRGRQLIDASEGRGGLSGQAGHAGAHVPPAGEDPVFHTLNRRSQGIRFNTAYRVGTLAEEDLGEIVQRFEGELTALPPGGRFVRTASDGGAVRLRQTRVGVEALREREGAGWRSLREIQFDEVEIVIERLRNGELHVTHFVPVRR